MTAQEIRQAVQSTVEAHITHNNFHLDWLVVKDRDTEPELPGVFWKQYTGRLQETDNGTKRTQFVQLWVLTSVATDRTPAELQTAVEAAFEAAVDIVMRLKLDHGNEFVENVSITTMHDEYTNLLSGVVLNMTLDAGYACYVAARFPEPEV